MKKIKQVDILNFTREMKIMLESGIDIINSLQIQIDEIKNTNFKNIVVDIKKRISTGMSISEAFSKYKNIFDINYLNYLKIGEISGTLTENLQNIISQIELKNKIKQKIKEAIFYPSIIMIFSIFVIIFLVGFVLPGFTKMFEESDVKLPVLTNFLLWISHNMIKILISLIILIFLIKRLFKSLLKDEKFKINFYKNIFKIPLFGKIFIEKNIVEFSKNFSLMQNAGMNIVDIFDNIITNQNNYYLMTELKKIKRLILSGESISKSLEKINLFGKNKLKMIKIGEETGKITEILEKISIISYEEMENSIKKLLVLLEPFLMLVLGGIIGIIVTAIYMPIFSMSDLVR